MAIKWRRNSAENFNPLSRGHERYRRQTDRQTDGRRRSLKRKKRNIPYSSNIVKNGVLYG